jgi:hypothetical protein
MCRRHARAHRKPIRAGVCRPDDCRWDQGRRRRRRRIRRAPGDRGIPDPPGTTRRRSQRVEYTCGSRGVSPCNLWADRARSTGAVRGPRRRAGKRRRCRPRHLACPPPRRRSSPRAARHRPAKSSAASASMTRATAQPGSPESGTDFHRDAAVNRCSVTSVGRWRRARRWPRPGVTTPARPVARPYPERPPSIPERARGAQAPAHDTVHLALRIDFCTAVAVELPSPHNAHRGATLGAAGRGLGEDAAGATATRHRRHHGGRARHHRYLRRIMGFPTTRRQTTSQ